MGLTRRGFERMEFGEFMCAYLGHSRKREQMLSDLRLIVWSNLAPNSKKKLKPEDIIRLPGDSKKPSKPDMKVNARERFENLKQLWQPEN
jgi:hypothetical protein